MDGDESFGRMLRRQRRARDLTQEALAQQVFCATDTIKKLEQGLRAPRASWPRSSPTALV